MKKLFTLIFFYLSTFAHADAGYGYRFFIKAELDNTETYEGYIYVYSYEEYQRNGSLITFLKETSPYKEISIYQNIYTTHIDDFLLDFTVKGSDKKLKLDDIIYIKTLDTLHFGGGDYRLKELTDNEFALIKTQYPYKKCFNAYEIVEYCHFIFLSWDNKIENELTEIFLNKIKDYKKNVLDNSLEGEKGSVFYEFINKLKTELIKKNILLIQYCESC